MNFNVSCSPRASRLCLAGAFVLFAIVAIVGALVQPAVAASNIAYDEVTKFVMGNQTAPEPGTYATGSFQGDFQAAVDAGKPQRHGGIFGAIVAAEQVVKSLGKGTASSVYYWGGWKREDDLANQTATIQKYDRHQIIHLDLAHKTYYVVDMNARPVEEMPPPNQRPPGPQGPQPSPVPGTAKVAVTVTTAELGSKTISGEQATGYKLTFKIASTQATGSCINGTFETSMVEYVSSIAEPTVTLPTTGRVYHPRARPVDPEMMAMRPGCRPTYTAHTHVGPTAPGGKLALWELLALSAGAQTAQGSASGGFSTLLERGNIRTLGPADKSLFEIPPGFTQAQPSSP